MRGGSEEVERSIGKQPPSKNSPSPMMFGGKTCIASGRKPSFGASGLVKSADFSRNYRSVRMCQILEVVTPATACIPRASN